MNYLEKVVEILQRATVEEVYTVLKFTMNTVRLQQQRAVGEQRDAREDSGGTGG